MLKSAVKRDLLEFHFVFRHFAFNFLGQQHRMIALTLTPLAITALPLVAAASYPLLESWSGKGFL